MKPDRRGLLFRRQTRILQTENDDHKRRLSNMDLPQDPVILLSFVNTKLRDEYASLNAFCSAYDVEPAALCEKLAALNYRYAEKQNQFV